MLSGNVEEGVGMKGIKRFKQMVENQEDLHHRAFCLSFSEVKRLVTEIEDEFAQLSWAESVPTPKDADGEVVPLGTKKLYTDDGEMVRVESICYGARLWYVRRMHGDKTYRLDELHLHRPDSWERLEEDVARIGSADYPCDYFNHADCGMPCYSCPAHTDAEDCTAGLARDVLRRAKALAGVSDGD